MTAYTRVLGRTSVHDFGAAERLDEIDTAVSLHAHTHHSRESMSDVPRYMHRLPVIGWRIERELRACIERDGGTFDYAKIWWHPPVSARAVFESESAQIERRFGLRSIVSVTDHDDIRAGLELQGLYAARRAPISFEWTVPFGATFFHLGVHNLPPASAERWFSRLVDITARPSSAAIADALHDLDALDGTLIVLNHPQWDLAGVGNTEHRRLLYRFLAKHRPRLHALELNGYRDWKENESVWPLAAAAGLPLISGGDRHGAAPNAILNVTRARTFAEFAAEVRSGTSRVVVMPEYRQHLAARVVASVSDVFRRQHGHRAGGRLWTERVSWESGGEVRTLATYWPTGGPLWLRSTIRTLNVLTCSAGLSMIAAALQTSERFGDSDRFRWTPRGRPGVSPLGVSDAN